MKLASRLRARAALVIVASALPLVTGCHRHGGLFAAAVVTAAIISATPPPPPRVVYAPPPAPGYVWQPGYWTRYGEQWRWVEGRWVPVQPSYQWLPPHWEQTSDGQWRQVPGRWVPTQPPPPPP
jgi:hypothetical protein